MKTYLVSQVEVIDNEVWQRYRALAAPAIKKFGGRYLVRGASPELVEGDDWAPPRSRQTADRHRRVPEQPGRS
ncbi:DUF1330 domain-containing protein [Frankia sp. R82]|uniref:DUF1330 domain-containing protein n=1 Tax=Frankia sp. R82 TaxID=2950553 RepID=UPI002043CA1D|nr:DUF1330 domain-containing protein [Frankia sp. R82]MCM3882170.1 DUF1330 domain-containing protein [Frankia sp. R82]